MKKILLFIFGSLLISSIWASTADAKHDDPLPRHGDEEALMDEGPGHRDHHRERMWFGDPEHMKKEIGLSNKQIEKIEEINLKFQKQLLEEREKMQPKRLELRKLLLEEKIDLEKVEKLLKEISEVEAEIRLARIKHRIEIEGLLTEKQKKKMKQEMKKEKKGRKGHD